MEKKEFTWKHLVRATAKGIVEQAKASIPGAAFFIGFEESLFNSLEKENEETQKSIIRDIQLAPLVEIESELKAAGLEWKDLIRDLIIIIKNFGKVWEEVNALKETVNRHNEILKRLMDFSRFPQVARILTLPPLNNIPHNRNIYFTGRKELILNLRNSLCGESSPAVLTKVMAGLGGVGKTQTAVEYCYRYGMKYSAILWVGGERLLTEFANLANVLQLEKRKDRDIQRVVIPAIRRWLDENPDWLLIFDNAEEPSALRKFLPKGGAGHIIITSRNTHWGSLAKPLDVPVMEKGEAKEFLLERSGETGISGTERNAVETLSKELGYLPLALEQAAAYIARSGCGFEKYLEYFRKLRPEMMKRAKPDQYPDTVATTWKISFDAAEIENPESIDLLKLCSFLAPDDIPLDMIREGREFLTGKMKTDLSLDDTIISLRHYSLISREGGFLSIHRLVQAVTRDELNKEEGAKWCASALYIVNKAFPQDSDDYRTWEACKILLPHAETILSHSWEMGICENKDYVQAAGRLLNLIGIYCQYRGLYSTAELLFRRALEIGEKTLGSDHPNVATWLNNLGILLYQTGRREEGISLVKKAYQLFKKTLGPDHPNTKTVKDCLLSWNVEPGE